ncbi:AAA family ATPase [Ferroplasma acidarmanus]|uniref:ATPase AAA-type core domain-containing protein n=1 Tax=Ferroplasma acidarmanus Fer1 TaxID=333146 RepID=S0ASU6_FERAC|nr:AAA family ATPase [Ferroplasma acidarmanus]AGO61857.1 hypothetical protein FACI_IFERC00001G1881 [Ferroplasma acidarmanus Fer1]
MNIEIKKIIIKNFKSIKNITLNINDLIVMVGKNGSGKTNIIEAINFNKVLFKPEPIKSPFTKWWGYSNLVYNHNIEEPISFSFNFTVDGHKLFYEYDIMDNNGLPNFISEHIVIENYVDILREGSKVEIKHLDNAIEKLSKTDFGNIQYLNIDEAEIFSKIKKTQYINDISTNQSIISMTLVGSSMNAGGSGISRLNINRNMGTQNFFDMKNYIIVASPILKPDNKNMYNNLADFVFFSGLRNIFNNIIAAGPIDYKAIKNRVPVAGPSLISEDGSGLVRMLYQYFLKNRSLPELVENGIKTFFPGWELNFEAMPDGTVTLVVKYGDGYFYPPNLPLGFYKLIMVLELIEQKPELLIIDEIENSFHEKMIEYILDAISARGIKTIISTHSPMVVDLVDLKNILIVKMVNNQTKVERISNPRRKAESLIKEGITPSESLLYGGIDH